MDITKLLTVKTASSTCSKPVAPEVPISQQSKRTETETATDENEVPFNLFNSLHETPEFLFPLLASSDDHPDSLVPKWFPDSPSFSFFPYPVIDNERPWGQQCKDCGGKCSGHYVTNIDVLMQLHQSAKTIRALPPSVIIEEACKKNRHRPPSLQLLASKCCLSEEQVQMCWDHLQQNALNRARGVEKAKATRQKKKAREKKNDIMSV